VDQYIRDNAKVTPETIDKVRGFLEKEDVL
jgi:hypothetical protein